MIGESWRSGGAAAGIAARIGIIIVLAGCPAAIARAEPLRDGTAAFAKGDTATALRLLAPLAAAGDPAAECMMTVMRDKAGDRIAYDAAAMSATCIGVARGEADAELDLAGDYRTGLILARDVGKAAALYRLAADQGSAVAQKVLGDLYAEGLGVQRDFASACRWWGRAAMQGESSEAERDYGGCYLTGTGVARSESRALAWWLIARANEQDDRKSLPSWVFQGEADADRAADALRRRLSADEVAAAQAFADAWRPKPE
jgi:TPR repeat protein